MFESMNATRRARILVVDDEPAARSALAELLKEEGYEVRSAADGFKALGRVDAWGPDVLITDLKMPGMSGVELMHKLREKVPDVSVVVMTAYGSIETAVSALQDGAQDFLTKPISLPHLLTVLERVLEHRALREEARKLRERLAAQQPASHALAGNCRAIRQLRDLVEQVAPSKVSVLIRGEKGTGKKTVARALHDRSDRSEGPFVAVRCRGMDAEVLERELFGEGGGEGLVHRARGGTLFLDDVDALPPSAQAKVLHLLEEGTLLAGTDAHPVAVDVRVVAATEVDLDESVRSGAFRDDLFFRLGVVQFRMPSLRERVEDIPVLAAEFLRRFARHYRKGIDGFTERALGVLSSYDWPGNVQELEACIERAVVLCRGNEIEPRHLPREVMQRGRTADDAPAIPGSTMRDIERYAILRTLEHVGGSTSKAAKILGISPRKIQYRLAEYREEGLLPARAGRR